MSHYSNSLVVTAHKDLPNRISKERTKEATCCKVGSRDIQSFILGRYHERVGPILYVKRWFRDEVEGELATYWQLVWPCSKLRAWRR